MTKDDWITDRPPTKDEVAEYWTAWVTEARGKVAEKEGWYIRKYWDALVAWLPHEMPAPYVPPKLVRHCPVCGGEIYKLISEEGFFRARCMNNCFSISVLREKTRDDLLSHLCTGWPEPHREPPPDDMDAKVLMWRPGWDTPTVSPESFISMKWEPGTLWWPLPEVK
jgi:hypothetical protein